MDLEALDLDTLLAPIPGPLPQGVDAREDDSAQRLYNRMRDARSEARAIERQLEAPDSSAASLPDPAPLWRNLLATGAQLLAEQTKDLEVAAWIAEALVREDGLRGLAVASQLIIGLIERYWDDVYPLPDEYGLETRLAPLAGLNGRTGSGTLIAPLHQLVLFHRSDGSPFKLHQYNASADLSTKDAATRQRVGDSVLPFELVETEAQTIGRARMENLRHDAADALTRWNALDAVVDAKAGDDAPSFSRVREEIEKIAGIAQRYAPAPSGASEAQGLQAEPANALSAAAHPALLSSDRPMTRENALRTLEQIAAFIRETEPHSPLSFTLTEAVRRARLPWLALLEETLTDRASREAFLTSLGIRPPEPQE